MAIDFLAEYSGRKGIPFEDDVATERSITVNDPRINNGKWTNIPSIYNGKVVDQETAIQNVAKAGGIDPETGRHLLAYDSLQEAEKEAKLRSESLTVDKQNRQQIKAVDFFAKAKKEPVDFFAKATKKEPIDFLDKKQVDIFEIYRGATEAATSVVTGLAGTAAGGLAGIGASIGEYVGFDVNPTEVIEDVQTGLTYSPTEDKGKSILNALAIPFEWWREHVSKPVGEATYETAESPRAGTVAYTAAEILPWIVLPKVAKTTGKGVIKGVEHTTKLKMKHFTDPVKAVTDPVKLSFAPISTGVAEARVAAKTYANNIRMADTLRNEVIQKLDKKFTKEDMTKMADATIAEELASARDVKAEGGFATLAPEQQQAITMLMDRHKVVVDEAIELGILKSHKENYFPRKTIEVLDPKAIDRIQKAAGIRLAVTTKHAKKRKYETVEETAAAASELLGKEMKVVNDIRVLPIVTAELQRAIAGKTLVNEIKAQSKALGVDTIINGEKPGYFTIDHPAMKQWKPRLRKDEEGKWAVVKDEFGEPIFDKQPIFIHESFKGPLDAVLKNESGTIANAFMQLKAKSMSMIMFNPLMHGMVIWGKALPFQPYRTFTFRNYAEGRRLYNGPEMETWVKHGTQHGLAPIGNQGWMQRMNDIMSTPQLSAGRSWTAKVTGKLAKPFGKEEAAMTLIDKAGHFWHDTLLWEPIRHAQLGMYKNLYDGFVKKGMNEDAAGYAAAHMANRFAGSVPFEDMGHGIRAASNFMLFSRTFNTTNIGIYKDALKGLPTAVQDQILKLGSELDLKIANNKIKHAARATLAKDIVAMYVLNSMFENAIEYWNTGEAGPIAQEYAQNIETYKEKVDENPLNALLDFHELTAQSIHEPGKEHRIYMGLDPYGSATYLRNPIGKIGEDLEKLATSPLAMATDKLSPTMKFLMGVATNDKSINKGYNLEIYDKTGSLKDAPENLGKILSYFIESHTPASFIESTIDVFTNHDPTGIQYKKMMGQLAGFATSTGAPGGPAMGYMYQTLEKRKKLIRENMPDIIKELRLGNQEKAMDIMVNKAGMNGKDIEVAIRKIHPTLNEKTIKQFVEKAEPYEMKKLDRMFKKYYKLH